MKDKINIDPFVVGDEVVYITGISMPKNSIHIVERIVTEPCGCCAIILKGIESPFSLANNCTDCNTRFPLQLYCFGWDPNSFRKVQTQHVPLMSFEKIKESETKKQSQEQEILIPN